MTRYLLRFSYIGDSYRGLQKQVACKFILDVDSVQGALETALKTLIPRSINEPTIVVSSRTDAGVHALYTSAHVELENKYGVMYHSDAVISHINKFFRRCHHTIRLLDWIPITKEFHARKSALSRTYMYRLMVAKTDGDHNIPIVEHNRSCLIRTSNVDFEKAKEATKLFIGRKDFMTFSSDARRFDGQYIRYIRNLNQLTIEKANPLAPFDPLSNNFDFWHITCSAKGFLYNQVRRIVTALLGIATNTITERDIKIMLQVPSHQNWDTRLPIVPPSGLYLVKVEYDEKKLEQCTIPYPEDEEMYIEKHRA